MTPASAYWSKNALDMDQAREEGVSGALLDRQLLTDERIEGIAAG